MSSKYSVVRIIRFFEKFRQIEISQLWSLCDQLTHEDPVRYASVPGASRTFEKSKLGSSGPSCTCWLNPRLPRIRENAAPVLLVPAAIKLVIYFGILPQVRLAAGAKIRLSSSNCPKPLQRIFFYLCRINFGKKTSRFLASRLWSNSK